MPAVSTKRKLSDWGVKVKKILLEKDMSQDDVISILNNRGYKISKATFSNLLRGLGYSTNKDVIEEINSIFSF